MENEKLIIGNKKLANKVFLPLPNNIPSATNYIFTL